MAVSTGERFFVSKEVLNMFSRIAPTYDRANRVLSLDRDRAWRDASVALLNHDGFTPARVLDLCAGTGDFTLAVRNRYPDCKVTLADFAKPMLDLARKKMGGVPGLTFRVADAMKIPFPGKSFDGIVCGFGLRNLDDPAKGLKEMARVLKPGGRACILEFFRPAGPVSRLAFHLVVKRLVPMLGGKVSGDPEAYRYLTDSASRFLSAAEAVARMEEAGFTDVRKKSFMFGIATALVGVRR